MNIKQNCEKYLRYKYEYYILGKPSISDYEFDVFEKELKATGDKLALEVTDIVDFPNLETILGLGLDIKNIAPIEKIKRDETKYKHWTPMLSIKKLQVNDEKNIPYNALNLFMNKKKADYYLCSCKYDGNAMDLMYNDGKIEKALTRGDGVVGLDRLNKVKHIVPNHINIMGKVQIRGEIVINRHTWKKKYYNDKEVSNERNFVAGALSTETFNFETIKDLSFIAFSLVLIDENKEMDNTMDILKSLGFNSNHEPFLRSIKDSTEFEKMYFDFKEYRKNCEFLLDGIVIKYPEHMRIQMGSNNKYPTWALAVKFESTEVETEILEYEWSYGKDGVMSPIALIKEVELGGTMNRRASCHNLSWIMKNYAFPGSIVMIRKAGEIINQVTEVVELSPYHDQYMKEYQDYLKNQDLG